MVRCSRQQQDRVQWCALSLATANLQCSNTREILKVVTISLIQLITYALVIHVCLVNDQIDAQFFSMYLFQFSACFEQPRAHHQKNQLYHYNIWCSDFTTCTRNGHRHRVTYTRCCSDTINSPDDEHEVARNMQRIEINTQKRIVRQFGHLPRIITRCTVNKI